MDDGDGGGGLTEAPHGALKPERAQRRNGYREQAWATWGGRMHLAIPKLRKGAYLPSFLKRRRTAEQALTAVIQEACVQGVSTRAVDDLVKAMGGISKSQVSRLLTHRGLLRGVKLMIADDHTSLRAAAAKVFNAAHQRYEVHWLRNALAYAPSC